MTLVRRPSPFGEIMSLRQAMDRLFDDSFLRSPFDGLTWPSAAALALDVVSTPDALVVEAALPGVAPDEVEITVEHHRRYAPGTVVVNKVDCWAGEARIEPNGAPDAGPAAALKQATAAPEATRRVRIYLSASTGEGLPLLRQHLKDCVGFHPAGEGVLSARTRHLDALRRARTHVEEAHRLLTGCQAGELVAQELTDAQKALGEITGQVTSDDLLGRIFASFCIGK